MKIWRFPPQLRYVVVACYADFVRNEKLGYPVSPHGQVQITHLAEQLRPFAHESRVVIHTGKSLRLIQTGQGLRDHLGGQVEYLEHPFLGTSTPGHRPSAQQACRLIRTTLGEVVVLVAHHALTSSLLPIRIMDLFNRPWPKGPVLDVGEAWVFNVAQGGQCERITTPRKPDPLATAVASC